VEQPLGQFAPVNGLNLYYEIHGTGRPLVLLHGGVTGIRMFGDNVAALARNRQVIAVEMQGHGRTIDIDRPLSFEFMADDIAELLRYLNITSADVLGLSLGGGVALQIAIRHPKLLRKLVVAGAACKRAAYFPEVLEGMERLRGMADVMKQSPLYEFYPNVNWATLFTKLSDLLKKDYDWSREVGGFRMPVLLVFADADCIRPGHMVEFYGLLGGGQRDAGLDGSLRPASQLAILPGHTHYTLAGSPALAAAAIPFLDA
jgi:pimeloyl-ACP methyl ester carboxylesterase